MTMEGYKTTQYGVSEGSPKAMNAITACFWMSTPAEYANKYYPTPLSYKVKGATWGNTFMLDMRPDLTLYVGKNSYK